ncbi:MAG: DHHA1 domain-containing protein [Minisyncoccales bacterium]
MEIQEDSQIFLEKSEDKVVKIVSHHDTDGITSAAIMAKTLKKLDRQFTIKIVKRLEEEHIKTNKNEILLLLDLGSSYIEKLGENSFVIDHHETIGDPKDDVTLINPYVEEKDNISSSGITYLFSKKLIGKDEKLANLGVIGMIGDRLKDSEDSNMGKEVIEDASLKVKKGLQLYPATRPIHKALEFSSSIYIPGITGKPKKINRVLKEIGIKKEKGQFKRVIDLNEDETNQLLNIILSRTKMDEEELMGEIYIVNFFDRKMDAREISSMINACSRQGHKNTAFLLCLEKEGSKRKVEDIYANYKQRLISALNYAEENMEKGKSYVLVNGKDKIGDTIIGTISSILANSKKTGDGKIVLGMAKNKDNIKVSARLIGNENKNVREILKNILDRMEGDYRFGGHSEAAGCQIPIEKEENFINNMKEVLKMDVVKV